MTVQCGIINYRTVMTQCVQSSLSVRPSVAVHYATPYSSPTPCTLWKSLTLTPWGQTCVNAFVSCLLDHSCIIMRLCQQHPVRTAPHPASGHSWDPEDRLNSFVSLFFRLFGAWSQCFASQDTLYGSTNVTGLSLFGSETLSASRGYFSGFLMLDHQYFISRLCLRHPVLRPVPRAASLSWQHPVCWPERHEDCCFPTFPRSMYNGWVVHEWHEWVQETREKSESAST